nr:hypothetical protein WCOTENJF_WCOTENJF_CDS_0029 [uncultured phage]
MYICIEKVSNILFLQKKPPRRDGAEAFNFYRYLKRFNLNDFP